AGQATTPAVLSVTATVKNTTTPSVSSTRHGRRPHVTTGMTAAATNTSLKHETASTPGRAATTASAATTTQRGRPSTRSRRQTTATGGPTATAATSTTTTRAGTQTAPTSARTVRPPPAPQPSAIPTGTYTLSDGNGTCVKAVMGLQLMARNTQQEQMEYVTVNPNATQVSGSCGMMQSELNLTFSGGFVNFTFVK
ncbi:LAMP3 protein, partial [Eulacestoma nigropectus]|nr:LAMP3 protein [Eulacestoma nigropectus]